MLVAIRGIGWRNSTRYDRRKFPLPKLSTSKTARLRANLYFGAARTCGFRGTCAEISIFDAEHILINSQRDQHSSRVLPNPWSKILYNIMQLNLHSKVYPLFTPGYIVVFWIIVYIGPTNQLELIVWLCRSAKYVSNHIVLLKDLNSRVILQFYYDRAPCVMS